jgi:thiamine biosynthesis lipoprotein
MACRFEVTLPGYAGRDVPAAQAALQLVDRLEDRLSVFRSASELCAVNERAAAEAVRVGPEVLDLVRRCKSLYEATEGAFDPTSTPLSRSWGFLVRSGRLPTSAEIAQARARVGMSAVALDERDRSVRYARPGIELNFNAIGKGYAIDGAAHVLDERGVGRALLSAGGSSLRALRGGREGFVVDVRSPRQADGPLARLRLRHAALGTSGAGEQFFEAEGRRYGHVLDPRTGGPAEGTLSASVVADDAATADALATAFLVGGQDLAERYCRAHARTLALITLESDPAQLHVVGGHDGVEILSRAGEA